MNALDQSHGATPNIKVNSKCVFQKNVQWQNFITGIGHITNVEDQLMSSPAFDAKYGQLVSWLEFYNCISATPILEVFSCPYGDHMRQILIGYLETLSFGIFWPHLNTRALKTYARSLFDNSRAI